MSPGDLTPDEIAWFHRELAAHLKVPWRANATQPVPGYSIAMLHDPEEALPPSRQPTLDKFVRVGAQMGIEVEPIRKQDLHRLAEFDGLFIRETTAITNHTYRFARRAEREGLAVIDDPTSIVRCTNKVYLAELLAANGVPTPSTVVLDRRHLKAVGAKLAFPLVLKVPDGSFSRGVFKVNDEAELHRRASELLEDSDLILAQEYVPTQFDWRVGVLNRAPLYVCQYFMSKNHWQIVKHEADGRFEEGTFKTYAVEQAPREVVDLALRARRADRRRAVRGGHQADRTRPGRDRDQRQSESRGRDRGRGPQGRALSPGARRSGAAHRAAPRPGLGRGRAPDRHAGSAAGGRSVEMIGVLGGMGPAATLDFLAKLVRLPVERDQDHVPVVVLSDPRISDRIVEGRGLAARAACLDARSPGPPLLGWHQEHGRATGD